MVRRHRIIRIFFAFLALTLAAPEVSAQGESLDDLYQKAKQEGTVIMYASVPNFILEEWKTAFQNKYPGVKLEYFRSGTGKVLARIAAEKKAGRVHGDLVWVADVTAFPNMAKDGLLASYKSPEWDHIPLGKDPQGYYVTGRILAGVIFANTKLLKTFPGSWADLALPQYKDQVSMASALVSGSTTVMVSALVSRKDFGWPYFEKLKSNNILVLQDVPDVARAVASGEKPLGITLTLYKYQSEFKDSPLKIIFPKEGVILMPSPLGIFKDAEHPAAARLLYRFLLSPEGQSVLSKNGIYPARDDAPPPEGLPELSKVKSAAIVPDLQWMVEHWDEVKSRWRSMIGH